MKGGNSYDDTICAFCGLTISLNSYALHTAQCKYRSDSQISGSSINPHNDINEIFSYSKSGEKSPRNNNFSSKNDFISSNNIYDHFPMISNNQTTTELKNLNSLGNFEKLYSNEESPNYDINSSNKMNNFTKIDENFSGNRDVSQIRDNSTVNRSSRGNIEIEKRSEHEINYNSDSKICPLCYKEFDNNLRYEMHVSHCTSEEDAQAWENFENNNDINYNNNVYERNFHNHFSDEDNSYYPSQSQDLDNSNLDYEDLVELDENVYHPLPKQYVDMLGEENLTPALFSKLNEENKKCMVCLEDFEVNQKIIRLPCFHIFHVQEIFKWFERNKTCPFCRMDVEKMLKEDF
jgi:hypothetical protein